jgi:hypothetical protein
MNLECGGGALATGDTVKGGQSGDMMRSPLMALAEVVQRGWIVALRRKKSTPTATSCSKKKFLRREFRG